MIYPKSKNKINITVFLAISAIILIAVINSYHAYGKPYFSANKTNQIIGESANTINIDSKAEVYAIEKIMLDISALETKEKTSMYVWATAYTSDPKETDNTPFITASGVHVYDGVVASNFLPLGTKLRIPELFGDKIFTIEDRMNPRYNGVKIVDIWFANKIKATRFGKRFIKIEIL